MTLSTPACTPNVSSQRGYDLCVCVCVQYARGFKDPALARPWSKHSEGSSARAKALQAAGLPTGQSRDVDGSAAEAQALAHKLKLRAGRRVNTRALMPVHSCL